MLLSCGRPSSDRIRWRRISAFRVSGLHGGQVYWSPSLPPPQTQLPPDPAPSPLQSTLEHLVHTRSALTPRGARVAGNERPVKDLSAGKSRGNDMLNSPGVCACAGVCLCVAFMWALVRFHMCTKYCRGKPPPNPLPPSFLFLPHALANFCLASFASWWRGWLNI